MRKVCLLSLVTLLLSLSLATPAFAPTPGPFVMNGVSVTCDPNTEPELVGYYVYWRIVPATTWDSANRVKIMAGPGVKWNYPLASFPFKDGVLYELCCTAFDAADNESGISNIIRVAVGPTWCSEEFKTRVKDSIDFIMRYNGVWNLERYREYLEGRMMLRMCPP